MKLLKMGVNSIGIRATPKEVYFAIVKEQEGVCQLHVVDKVILPKTLSYPEKLQYLRGLLVDIIAEFNITNACIRITESTAERTSTKRVSLEAVIQELIASSCIVKYKTIRKQSMASLLDLESSELTDFICKKRESVKGINIGDLYNSQEREAILSAYCALHI